MKSRTFGFFAAALFMFASGTALADHSGGWRLGERVDGGYAIYHRGYRVPGSAVGLGDGWVLGTKRESGGYAIYRWNGRDWDQAPGGAVEIGGTYRRPWVVNNRGQRFTWNGYDWEADFRGYRGNNHHRDRNDHRYGSNRHRNDNVWRYFGRDFDNFRFGRDSHRDYHRDRHDRGYRDRSDRRGTRW